MIELQEFALDDNGELDLFKYMHNVFWLDLGELLYILKRGRSVSPGVCTLEERYFRPVETSGLRPHSPINRD